MKAVLRTVALRIVSAWFAGVAGTLLVGMICAALSLPLSWQSALWVFAVGALIGLVLGPRAVGVLYVFTWFSA